MALKSTSMISLHLARVALGSPPNLNLPQINQEQKNWCWAGCAQMVSRSYVNLAIKQCEVEIAKVRTAVTPAHPTAKIESKIRRLHIMSVLPLELVNNATSDP